MKVIMAPADQHGCGHYRMRFPAEALADDVDIELSEGFEAKKGLRSGKILGLQEPVNADVVVLQRPLTRDLVDLIPFMQRGGAAVVVDIDDDFSCLHHAHPTFLAVHPKYRPDHNWHHLRRACSLADLVTCSTKALATRYGGMVLPNYVPARYLEVKREATYPQSSPLIGWAGFTHSHPRDLTATRGGVRDALTALGGRFLTIGDGEGVADDLDLPRGLDRDAFDITGSVPFDDYPAAVAQLDVGIVPLIESKFNDAKSWLKGLEYASLGVPFVASATPEYELLVSEDLGLLARDRGRDWQRMITFAWRHRQELSAAYRQIVGERFTYELNAWRWHEAWAHAMRRVAA